MCVRGQRHHELTEKQKGAHDETAYEMPVLEIAELESAERICLMSGTVVPSPRVAVLRTANKDNLGRPLRSARVLSRIG
jgi:hypothetical protein